MDCQHGGNTCSTKSGSEMVVAEFYGHIRYVREIDELCGFIYFVLKRYPPMFLYIRELWCLYCKVIFISFTNFDPARRIRKFNLSSFSLSVYCLDSDCFYETVSPRQRIAVKYRLAVNSTNTLVNNSMKYFDMRRNVSLSRGF